MTAPTFVATAVTGAVLGVDLTVAVPTGTQNGDLMVAYGLCSSGTGITTPAGWTAHPISFGAQAPLFYRWASSEPGSYVFVTSGGGNSMIRIVTYRGVHATSPFDDADSHVGPTGNVILPATTSLGLDRLLAQFIAKAGNTTFTGPGTTTERWDAASPSSLVGNAGGDEVVGSGAIGTRTWTPAAGTQSSIGYILVLAPSAFDATVVVPAAAQISTASAPAPVVTGIRNGVVAAVAATMTLLAPTPGVTGAQNTTVTAPAASYSIEAPTPTATGTQDGTVVATPATLTVAAQPPTVNGEQSATVLAAPATLTTQSQPPAVSATRSPDVAATVATVAWSAAAPGVSGQRNADTAAVPATWTLEAPAPTVAATIDATVPAPTAILTTTAPAPAVVAAMNATIAPPVATLTVAVVAPTVFARNPYDVTVLSVTEVHRTVTIGWSTPTAYGSGTYGAGTCGQIPAPRTVTVTEVPRPIRIETVP